MIILNSYNIINKVSTQKSLMTVIPARDSLISKHKNELVEGIKFNSKLFKRKIYIVPIIIINRN